MKTRWRSVELRHDPSSEYMTSRFPTTAQMIVGKHLTEQDENPSLLRRQHWGLPSIDWHWTCRLECFWSLAEAT